MGKILPPANTQAIESGAAELYLRIGQAIFGVSFTDLAEARQAARQINLSGRDVEIFEKKTGKVLEWSAGLAGKQQSDAVAPFVIAKPELNSEPGMVSQAAAVTSAG